VWTGPGAAADVVIFDLQLQTDQQEFGQLRQLVDSGRRVVVYTQDPNNAIAIHCISLGALATSPNVKAQNISLPPFAQRPAGCLIPHHL
jgi:hypothetical protein